MAQGFLSMVKWWCLAASALGLIGCRGEPARPKSRLAHVQRWLCYYGGDRKVLKSPDAQMLVLDADALGPLTDDDRRGRICLAYLSMGEGEESRWYWDEVKKADFIQQKNPNWSGAHLVDPRSPAWRQLVVQCVARRLVEKGYDGFFLDTLDTVEALLHADAARYEGADAAMAQLVADLRYEYPKAALLANRGFRLMERIAPHVDGVLVEGVRLTYDFEAKKSRPLTPDETAWMDAQLNKARSLGLPVFALDYVEPWDAERGRGAADALRRAGCRPFVSVLKLDRLPGQGETP